MNNFRQLQSKMQKKSFPKHNSGKFRLFTLIELLVVISIITILVSMLLPALNKARNVAKKSKCVSNLKQLGVAITGYTDDYTGYFPPDLAANGYANGYNQVNYLARYINARRPPNAVSGANSFSSYKCLDWGSGLYLSTNPIFLCPASNSESVINNYAWNGYISGAAKPASGSYNIKYSKNSQMKKPSTIQILLDSTNYYTNYNDYFSPPGTISYRHSSSTNVLWCDFHVSSTKSFLYGSNFF